MKCGWGCGAQLTGRNMRAHFTMRAKRSAASGDVERRRGTLKVKRGRPAGPRVPCGWGCGEQLMAPDARALHTMPKSPAASDHGDRRGFEDSAPALYEWRVIRPELSPMLTGSGLHGSVGCFRWRRLRGTWVNAFRHRRTYRQEPGHKGALAVRLRKLAIDGEKTLQGSQNLRTSRASRCSAFSV
jgi:hypothetical protein